MNWLRRGALVIGLLCALLSLSRNVFAQGCASCYTTAAAGGPQTAHALRNGILVLLFPPTVIFAGIIITVRKWKKAAHVYPSLADPRREVGRSEPTVERGK